MTHDGTSGSILHIQKLKLKTNIGVTRQERSVPQVLLVDIKISFKSLPKLAVTDDIKDGYCYNEIIRLIQKFARSQDFKLIEHFTVELHKLLKTKLLSEDFNITVTKEPKIKGFDGLVSFEYGKIN